MDIIYRRVWLCMEYIIIKFSSDIDLLYILVYHVVHVRIYQMHIFEIISTIHRQDA